MDVPAAGTPRPRRSVSGAGRGLHIQRPVLRVAGRDLDGTTDAGSPARPGRPREPPL